MRGALIAMLFTLFGAGAAVAADAAGRDPVGDWHGVLALAPSVQLRLLVHIDKAAGGALKGSLTSVDQSASAAPMTSVSAGGDTLAFTLDPLHAAYAGTWDAKQGAWVGTWTQSGKPAPLNLTPGGLPSRPTVAGLDGDWMGTLDMSVAKLRLVLHVKTGAGGTAASLDSVDQGANGIPVSALTRDGAKVEVDLAGIGARFSGVLAADGRSIAGQWSQGGSRSLTFERLASGQTPPKLVRPQIPKRPYPYREEDVSFDDAGAKVKLAGALTLPAGKGPFPAVVLVAGSGPNTRNEPILGHEPFLVLADYLTRHGIAVLRYDKRGTGLSGGDYAKATTADFADDAAAAEAFLRARPEIDPRRVGLIGHSEGGLIVPMVAVRDPAVAFIVMMAGPGVDGEDILLEQGRLIGEAMQPDKVKLARAEAFRSRIFALVREEKDPKVATMKIKAEAAAFAKAAGVPESEVDAQLQGLDTDWFRFFFSYDPAPTLSRVRCPVLALIGSLDLQVPADQNLPPIRKALAGNRRAEVRELPGLNHLFQPAKTGAPSEYSQIETTIAPSALDLMTDWVLKESAKP